MAEAVRIQTPLDDGQIARLSCGQIVLLSGTVYTARDAAHARLLAALDADKPLPVDLGGQVVYYAGPTPARPGEVIGSCGPTTAGRMDAFAPQLMRQAGMKGMIGKGPRSAEVIKAMREHGCVYFAAVGGAAALIAESVEECQVVAYDDLGPEAIRRLKVVDYPCVVAIDAQGNDLYECGPREYRRG